MQVFVELCAIHIFLSFGHDKILLITSAVEIWEIQTSRKQSKMSVIYNGSMLVTMVIHQYNGLMSRQ